jgi:hypothetical protein
MLRGGPSCGHDFDFHLLSWLEAANQFAHHTYPRWAFTPAWNAGEPRFVFYPPISWVLGGLLGLVLPWTLVPAAFTWVALTASGLTMHRLARRYCSPHAALLAATLYLANPYMLFTAYERTAYAELLAAAWLPLLFAAALASRVRVLPIAAALALTWLTNAPAGVMASYALAFLIVVRLVQTQSASRLALAVTATAGTALGFGLTAFYLLPAAYEQRFVQVALAVTEGMRPQDHFLFHHMGTQSADDLFHDDVVRTASIIALALLAAIVVALLAGLRKPTPNRSPTFPLATLTLLLAFLLTPLSLPLWDHIPKLAFLQFPWRLNALLAVILATAAAHALQRLPALRQPRLLAPLSCTLAVLLILPAWRLFHQPCDAEDSVPARVALFHSGQGTEGTDEYTTAGLDTDSAKPGNPPWWLAPSDDPDASPTRHAPPGPAPDHLQLDLHQPALLVLNRRAYPLWQIAVNAQTSAPPSPSHPDSPQRSDGLIVVPLAAGPNHIDLQIRPTPDQNFGLALSSASLLTALFLLLQRRRKIA